MFSNRGRFWEGGENKNENENENESGGVGCGGFGMIGVGGSKGWRYGWALSWRSGGIGRLWTGVMDWVNQIVGCASALHVLITSLFASHSHYPMHKQYLQRL